MENLSQTIQELCIENNITAKELAQLVNVSASLMYDYINDIKTPTINNLLKIANYFNCSIDYLVGIELCEKSNNLKSDFDNKVFFHRYNQLLKSKNISHYSLSKILGFSKSTYYDWKNGSIPYLDTLVKIAKYFDVSVDYLVGRSDS